MKPFALALQKRSQIGDAIAIYMPETAFYLFDYYFNYNGINFFLHENKSGQKNLFFMYNGKIPEYYLAVYDGQSPQDLQNTCRKFTKFKTVWLFVNQNPWGADEANAPPHDKHQTLLASFGKYFDIKEGLTSLSASELNYEDRYLLYELHSYPGVLH